jgi:hypothetical protein
MLLFLLSNIYIATGVPHTNWQDGSYVKYNISYTLTYNRDLTSDGQQIFTESEDPDIDINNGELILNYTGTTNGMINFGVSMQSTDIKHFWEEVFEQPMSYLINETNYEDQSGFPNRIYAKTDTWSLSEETQLIDSFIYEDENGVQKQYETYKVDRVDVPMSLSLNSKERSINTIVTAIDPFLIEYVSSFDRLLSFRDNYILLEHQYASETGLLLSMAIQFSFEIRDRKEADRYDEFVTGFSFAFSMTATQVSSGFKLENDYYTPPPTTTSLTTSDTVSKQEETKDDKLPVGIFPVLLAVTIIKYLSRKKYLRPNATKE